MQSPIEMYTKLNADGRRGRLLTTLGHAPSPSVASVVNNRPTTDSCLSRSATVDVH